LRISLRLSLWMIKEMTSSHRSDQFAARTDYRVIGII
jgi:hypothetical protein